MCLISSACLFATANRRLGLRQPRSHIDVKLSTPLAQEQCPTTVAFMQSRSKLTHY